MRIWGQNFTESNNTCRVTFAQCRFNAPNYVEFAQVTGASGTAHIFTTWFLHFATADSVIKMLS